MKTVLLLGLIVVVFAVVAGWWFTRGPDASEFAYLKEPRLARLSDQRMLVVEATGDPNAVAGNAYKELFGAYYRLAGISRASKPPAPRARWPLSFVETPKEKWIGSYAIPIPESARSAADDARSTRVAIATWTYGDVAEVLHVGPYSSEQADIERVHAFVRSQGYRPVGDHEEEYVKGPGIFTKPEDYLTIIRLRVEKSSPGQDVH